jgi:hypothetical protein
MRSFIFYTQLLILLRRSNQGEWCRRGIWHAWERRGKCAGFWCERTKERDHSEDRGVDGRMGSEWILGRLVGGGSVEWIQFSQGRDGCGLL